MAINFPSYRHSSGWASTQSVFETNVLLSVGPDPTALLLLIGTAALSACSFRLFSFGTGGVATADAGADGARSMDMTVPPDRYVSPDRSGDAPQDASWPEDGPRDGGVDARVADASPDAPRDMELDLGVDARADSGPVLPSTLVGWWPLNGNILDYSGRGNNLTFFGDEDGDLTNNFISDRTSSGQALSLDGVNDYAQTAEPVLLGFSDRWTIGFWLYLQSDSLQVFFSIGNSTGADAYRDYVEVITNEGMRNLSGNYYGDDAGLNFQYSTPTDVLLLNTWQHVAITNSGGSVFEDLRIYVNCVSQSLPLMGGELRPQSDLPRNISIGRQLDNDHYVNGAMDEFVIYNTDLDEAAVSETFCR